MSMHRYRGQFARAQFVIYITVLHIGLLSNALWGATPAENAAEQAKRRKDQALAQFIAEIRSGDKARITAAVNNFSDELQQRDRDLDAFKALDAMLAARLYKEVEDIGSNAAIIGANAADANALSQIELFRARALLADNKNEEALAAAKAYYNVCLLRNTPDAVDLVARCLAKARPDDKGLPRQFRAQQIAGAATRPSDIPKVDLGAPILPTIKIDAKPYQAVIDAAGTDDTYQSYRRKGNLLLLADRAGEAKKVFQEGFEAVEGTRDAPGAIEDIARALRAEAGNPKPANDYILSLGQKK